MILAGAPCISDSYYCTPIRSILSHRNHIALWSSILNKQWHNTKCKYDIKKVLHRIYSVRNQWEHTSCLISSNRWPVCRVDWCSLIVGACVSLGCAEMEGTGALDVVSLGPSQVEGTGRPAFCIPRSFEGAGVGGWGFAVVWTKYFKSPSEERLLGVTLY